MILADSDVLIDFLMGIEPVRTLVKNHIEANTLETSAITCFELLAGARQNQRGDKVRQFISNISVISLDREAASRAAAIRLKSADEGRTVSMSDSLIAGVALTHGLPLLTRNRKHFEAVEGLRLVPVVTSSD